MKQKLLIRKLLCLAISVIMWLGISSQGIYAFASGRDDIDEELLEKYSQEEIDAMSEEEYYSLFGIDEPVAMNGQLSSQIEPIHPDSLPAKSVADASFFRSFSEETIKVEKNGVVIKELYPCMQNFAVFKENGDTYIVRSTGGPTGRANIYIERRSFYGSDAMTFGAASYTSGNNWFNYNGHGDSVEVINHNGSRYIIYIVGTPYGSGKTRYIRGPYYLKCRKLQFDSYGDVSLGSVKTLDLFPTYNDVGAFDCKLAASDNYLCICVSYGTTKENDKERYMIYGKDDFIDALYSGATSQLNSSIQACRYATGWFTGNDSIGFIVPKTRTVIQSISIDEKKDENGTLQNFIVFAAVDDRGTNGTNGHRVHYINRAYIEPKAPGSSAAITAQNMKNNNCYYSKITHLAYSGKSVNQEFDLSSPPDGYTDERAELEGLKKIKAQGNGINAGWYVSTYNASINEILLTGISTPYFGNMPNISNDKVPWNNLIYKVPVTSVQVWTGN